MNETEEYDDVRQAIKQAMPDDLPDAVEQRMQYRLTAFAWKRGVRNALIWAVGILFVVIAAAAVIRLVCGQGISDSVKIAFAGQWGLVLLWFVGKWFFGRNTGGQILLDCGPTPARKGSLILAVTCLVIVPSLVKALSVAFSSTAVGIAAGSVLGVSAAICSLITATGRLQVRENGIWQYWSLLRWDKIDSYRWADESTLLLRTKGVLSLGQVAIPVPENRQGIDEFLSKQCSGETTAKPSGGHIR